MADQNTKAAIQYYDYQLITKQAPGINDRYTDIINYMPMKIPYYNDSYKKDFTQGAGELPDSSYISLVKRLGFKKINLYDRNTGETNLILDTTASKWMFTDAVFLDGTRYLFAVYFDYSRMRIYKQISVGESEGCGNDDYEDVTTGHFVNITKRGANRYFPFSKCLFDKFVITQFGKGKSKDSGVNGRVKNELFADYLSIQTIFYDPIVGNIGGGAGDFLCIYSGTLASQMNYISQNMMSTIYEPHISNAILLRSPFFGMYKVKSGESLSTISTTFITSVTTNQSTINSEESTDQKWKVFPEYGDILTFVTADGIMMMNYSNTKPSETEFTYEGATYFDTNFGANPPRYVISSLVMHDNAMYYYDIRSGRIFGGLQGVSKFYFDARNAFEFGKNYTHMISISGVMLLVGDANLSLMKPLQAGEGIVTFPGFMALSDNIGYFSRDSFCMEDGVFYIYNSAGKFFGRTFTSYYDVVTPAPKEIPVLYASDLTVLRKGRENVSVQVYSGDIYMFISHQEIVSSSIQGNTKILLYNSGCGLRHKWMLSGIVMKGFKNNTWFGDNLYSFSGNKDYNNILDTEAYYKTILKVQVGYESLEYTKNIAFTRTILGYNSFVTKGGTLIRHNIDLGGRHWELSNGDIWRDDYITNIMKLRKTGNTGTDFKNYPLGIAMQGGNGVGLHAPELRYLENEFSHWDAYAPVSSSISDEASIFTVSKMSTFQINLNIPVDHMTIEYLTYGDNALEIGGVLIGYTIDTVNQVRYSNNSTLQDSASSGPTGEPLTNDSGTESEVA